MINTKKTLTVVTLFSLLSIPASSFAMEAKPVAAKPVVVQTPPLKILKTPTTATKRLLKPLELKEVLIQAGFKGQDLVEAWAVAMKESTGRPHAHNRNSNTGDNSYGLFQINMIGSLGPARRDQYGLKTNKELFNPLINAKIAYHMSNGGKDWSAWNGITPRTKEFMKQFPH